MSVAYSYDGTFDGFLSSVFEAYYRREDPVEIVPEGTLQEALGQKAVKICTDDEKARRVEAGIIKKMGEMCYRKIWSAFLSYESCKAILLYRYMKLGFKTGRAVYDNIAHPDAEPVERMYINVMRESHLIKEFVRFSEMEGGAYYSRITPKNAVVPIIMPHFADRLSIQPFLIHDAANSMAGVYNLKGWHIVETGLLAAPKPCEDELKYRRMWKDFYDSIAIAERINPVCRRTHMPMRFWCNMTEHGYIPPEKPAKKSFFNKATIQNPALTE